MNAPDRVLEINLNLFAKLLRWNKKINGVAASPKEIYKFFVKCSAHDPLEPQGEAVIIFWRKWQLVAISLFLLILASKVIVQYVLDSRVLSIAVDILAIALSGLLLAIGIKRRQLLAKYRDKSIDVFLRDTDQFTLYLRSFDDDEVVTTERVGLFNYKGSYEKAFPWESEAFGPLSSYCGPVVAIGSPYDVLPPLIANLTYVKDGADWQSVVRDLMKRSRAIAVLMGTTTWVNWEIAEMLKSGSICKSIFFLPPLSDYQCRIRWEAVTSSFLRTAYFDVLRELNIAKLVAVSFESDGRITVYRARSRKDLYYKIVSYFFAYKLMQNRETLENK